MDWMSGARHDKRARFSRALPVIDQYLHLIALFVARAAERELVEALALAVDAP
jgi:hypothetical protein